MRKLDDAKPGFWADVAVGMGGMVGDATLSCMIKLARRIHSVRRRVASYDVTLVITRYRRVSTHVGV